MTMGRNINYYLMDNDINGVIKCSCMSLSLVAYKIPIAQIPICKDISELNNAGIYILYNSRTYEYYVGQANVRSGGKHGILKRVSEHAEEEFWDTALIFVTSNNSLGTSAITYLESYILESIIDDTLYTSKNMNVPSTGNVTIEERTELINIADTIIMYANILGFKTPNKNTEVQDKKLITTREHEVKLTKIGWVLDRYLYTQKNLVMLREYSCSALALHEADSDTVTLLSGSWLNREPFNEDKYNKYIETGYVTLSGKVTKDITMGIVDATKLVVGNEYDESIQWESCDRYNIAEMRNIMKDQYWVD